MSKSKWNKPEVTTLNLHKTLSPSGDKTCKYQGNVEACRFYEKKSIELLPVDDPTLYNKCKYSWGNDCTNESVPQS